MNLGKPPIAYMDVFEVVVRFDAHAALPQVVHCLLIFLLQCLDFLMAVLELLPVKLGGTELHYVLPRATAPG